MSATGAYAHRLTKFVNPYLACLECARPVRAWHMPDQCGCAQEPWNAPCEHPLGLRSLCPSWNRVDGCTCSSDDDHS